MVASRWRRSYSYAVLAVVALALAPPLYAHSKTSSAALTSAEVPAPATATVPPPIPDAPIAAAVTRRLTDDSALRLESVAASVAQGVCTLRGVVGDIRERDRALRAAETIKGVRSVVDQISVEADARADSPLEADVTTALHNAGFEGAHPIAVEVKEGTVTLTGTVSMWSEKALVTNVTKSVRGVKAVRDQVTVAPPVVQTDAEIAASVERRLRNDVALDGSTFGVAVKGRAVTLTGVVGSVAEKIQAGTDAWLGGAASVDDGGVVVDWAARDQLRHALAYAPAADADIEAAVRDAFKVDPELTVAAPEITVHRGVVELTGTLASERARRAAVLDTRGIVGVSDVNDRTRVDPGVKRTDAEIERAVRTALLDDQLLANPGDIQTSVANGTVLLRGDLFSASARADAVDVAAGILGVTGVTDEMTVDRTPEELKAAVEDRLFWDGTLERDRVHVEVGPDSVVTLTGNVDSWSETHAAREDAILAGATRVVDQTHRRH